MAGIVTHDVSSGGLRAAILTVRGREGYVASRMILALVLAALLGLWSVLLSMTLLLAPGATFEGMPAGELALRVVAHILMGWTYAVFCMLLLWLSRRFPRLCLGRSSWRSSWAPDFSTWCSSCR